MRGRILIHGVGHNRQSLEDGERSIQKRHRDPLGCAHPRCEPSAYRLPCGSTQASLSGSLHGFQRVPALTPIAQKQALPPARARASMGFGRSIAGPPFPSTQSPWRLTMAPLLPVLWLAMGMTVPLNGDGRGRRRPAGRGGDGLARRYDRDPPGARGAGDRPDRRSGPVPARSGRRPGRTGAGCGHRRSGPTRRVRGSRSRVQGEPAESRRAGPPGARPAGLDRAPGPPARRQARTGRSASDWSR